MPLKIIKPRQKCILFKFSDKNAMENFNNVFKYSFKLLKYLDNHCDEQQ